MTELDKYFWKLVLGIGLVLLWMATQSHGMNFDGLVIIAAFLQWPTEMHQQPVVFTWRGSLKSLLCIGAFAAPIWWLGQFIPEEESKAMLHSPIYVFGMGGVFIAVMINRWHQRRKASLEAQLPAQPN